MTSNAPANSSNVTNKSPSNVSPSETKTPGSPNNQSKPESSGAAPACILNLKLTPRPVCDHEHPLSKLSDFCESTDENPWSRDEKCAIVDPEDRKAKWDLDAKPDEDGSDVQPAKEGNQQAVEELAAMGRRLVDTMCPFSG